MWLKLLLAWEQIEAISSSPLQVLSTQRTIEASEDAPPGRGHNGLGEV